MLIGEERKRDFIEKFNTWYRTVLSYGDTDLVPNGTFVLTDIIEDDFPEEYKDLEETMANIKAVLTRVDDEKIELILPLQVLLNQYKEVAKRNIEFFQNLGITLAPEQELEKMISDISEYITENGIGHFDSMSSIPLDECAAEYYINGERQASNYSICPIDISRYLIKGPLERVKEPNDKNLKDKKSNAFPSFIITKKEEYKDIEPTQKKKTDELER